MNDDFLLIQGDARQLPLADESVDCCVTSPPYWGLRCYGVAGEIGMEATPQEYVETLVGVFREVRRALKPDGTLWVNLGDSYIAQPPGTVVGGSAKLTGGVRNLVAAKEGGIARPKRDLAKIGLPMKNLVGVPWRVALALQEDGWILRADVIWHKPNPMPEGATDRPTRSHEYMFLLTKSQKYFYDAEAIAEPVVEAGDTTRNCRTVWTIPTQAYKGAHFATYPEKLVEPCILAGCPKGGLVLDPFSGSGTTGRVALRVGRRYVGVDLNPEFHQLAGRRAEYAQVELFC